MDGGLAFPPILMMADLDDNPPTLPQVSSGNSRVRLTLANAHFTILGGQGSVPVCYQPIGRSSLTTDCSAEAMIEFASAVLRSFGIKVGS